MVENANESTKRGTPLWKALLLEHRLPFRYKEEVMIAKEKYNLLYIKHILNYVLFRFSNLLKSKKKEKQTIFVNIKGKFKCIFILLNYFKDYNILFYGNFDIKYYIGFGKLPRLIFSIKNLKVINEVPKKTEEMIYIYDEEGGYLNKEWKKIIKVSVDFSKYDKNNDSHRIVSFVVYPPLYKYKEIYNIKELRKNNRNIRLFFSGSIGNENYREKYMARFGKLSRMQIIDHINNELDKDKLLFIKNKKELKEAFNKNYLTRIIINDAYKIKIPVKRWLGSISKSDFLLCAPGVFMPICFNSIESMAVGTIPLTNYPDWFYPKLEDMKNCVAFNTKEDLIKKIDLILNMSNERIIEMRENVIKYYEDNLTAKSFFEKIELNNKSKITFFMPDENPVSPNK